MIQQSIATAKNRTGMAPLQSIVLLALGAMVIVGTHSFWEDSGRGIRSGTVASLDELFYGTPRNTGQASGSGNLTIGGSDPNGGRTPINDLPWSNPNNYPPGITPFHPENPELPFCPKAPETELPNGVDPLEPDPAGENGQPPAPNYLQMAKDIIDGLKDMTPEEQAAAMDTLQLLIDLAGIVDPTGVADGLNTLISAARGDWLGVGTGLAGTFLPYIGDSAKVLKLGKYADSLTNLMALAAKNPKLAQLVKGPLEATQKALASVVDKIPDRFAKTKDKLKALQGKLDDYLTPSVLPNGLPATTESSVKLKLEKYLLEETHPSGGQKANWFKKALGYSKDNLDDLAKQIRFDPNKAIVTATTEHGTKYNQIIEITGANGRKIDVTFAWIKNQDGVVRLVTSIPTKR